MLAQIVVNTNSHPFEREVVYFFLSLGPIILMAAFLIVAAYVYVRRNRRRLR